MMSYKWIVAILALILFLVLTKTELRYRFGNDPIVTASLSFPYLARAALTDLPDQRVTRLYDCIAEVDHAFI